MSKLSDKCEERKNEAQAKWKHRIIEIQAILTDREEDGTTENSSTES